jgi:hypothetical protein
MPAGIGVAGTLSTYSVRKEIRSQSSTACPFSADRPRRYRPVAASASGPRAMVVAASVADPNVTERRVSIMVDLRCVDESDSDRGRGEESEVDTSERGYGLEAVDES